MKDWLARFLSAAGSPYIVASATVLAVTLGAPGTPAERARWAALCISPVVTPFIFIVFMMSRGRITDLHVELRQHRHAVFAVTIATTMVAYALLLRNHAPPSVLLFGRAFLANALLFAAVTTRWKISVHTAILAGAAVIWNQLHGPVYGLTLAGLVVAVGWARTHRGRHTRAQAASGALLAAGVTWLLA